MKFNTMSLMKAVTDVLGNQKKIAERCKEVTKEPLQGYNEARTVRALYDLNRCRLLKIDIKESEVVDKDWVDVLEQVTLAVNNALDKADEVWEQLSPGSLKSLDK
jgi:DNA-binding protein YbaB